MATRIRLRRMGAKKAPFYRIVVADSRYPRDGRFIEEIGYYDPTKNPSLIKIDADRAKYWMGTGAQPSETVRSLMVITGVITDQPAYAASEKPVSPAETAVPAQAADQEEQVAPEEAADPEQAADPAQPVDPEQTALDVDADAEDAAE